MGVDLHKQDAGASALEVERDRYLPAPLVRFITAAWPAAWILLFIFTEWQLALVLMFMTGPVMAALHGKRGSVARARKRRRREMRDQHRYRVREHRDVMREQRDLARAARDRVRYNYVGGAAFDPEVASAGRPEAGAPQPDATRREAPVAASGERAASASAAERSLAATLVRAETSGGRLDAEAVALVREVEGLLRPLLARVRSQGADAQVQRDLDALATEHLPGALDAYLRLPATYVRDHRSASGMTPADELRSQLTLLLEGSRQLRDAVHDADLSRQQELSRYLEAKFRRSDLDL